METEIYEAPAPLSYLQIWDFEVREQHATVRTKKQTTRINLKECQQQVPGGDSATLSDVSYPTSPLRYVTCHPLIRRTLKFWNGECFK